jgi:MtN3 and saliva related transmembrane protein
MDEYKIYIGFSAALFTTFAFLPQSIKTIRTKHTKDLSLPMLVLFEAGLICWFTYGVLINDVPVIAANTISIVFNSITLVMKLKHG